jgi:hypothetical protein
MKLSQAVKIIRQELVTKDEPLKAWRLLNLFPELKGELELEWKNTKGMIRHCFDEEELRKAYQDVECLDCELIEPEEVIKNPAIKFHRYGWMANELQKYKPKTYLDMGCYVGSLVMYASGLGIKASGVDYTPKVIETAKRRALKLDLTPDFYVGDVRKFDKVKADFVSCFEVLEHIPEVEKFIEHLANLANEWVYVSTPDGPYGNGEGNIKQGWEWDGKGVRGHIRVFTKETIKDLLKNYEVGQLFTDDGGLLCFTYRKKGGKND